MYTAHIDFVSYRTPKDEKGVRTGDIDLKASTLENLLDEVALFVQAPNGKVLSRRLKSENGGVYRDTPTGPKRIGFTYAAWHPGDRNDPRHVWVRSWVTFAESKEMPF